MPADLIVYGLIAAGLIFWLRSILGTKHGDERDRSVKGDDANSQSNVISLGVNNATEGGSDGISLIEELFENEKGNMAIGNKTAENGLINIAKADRDFDIYAFLQATQDAFVYVVESFAEGDRDTLGGLLGQDVYNAFNKSIAAREKAGETMETEIHSIKRSEITDAYINGRTAVVTIRFLAEETSVTKDDVGEIMSGHPDRITKMRDVWVFSRDVKSRDPRWLVVETREDHEDDNDTLPNSH